MEAVKWGVGGHALAGMPGQQEETIRGWVGKRGEMGVEFGVGQKNHNTGRGCVRVRGFLRGDTEGGEAR